jgi:hypothetical protein
VAGVRAALAGVRVRLHEQRLAWPVVPGRLDNRLQELPRQRRADPGDRVFQIERKLLARVDRGTHALTELVRV